MASSFHHDPSRGFNFDNYQRNETVIKPQNIKTPNCFAPKKGTTICGAVCKDVVIQAADSRATGGSTVMDKDCMKLHYMAPNIYIAGAGTAADCDWVTKKMEAELKVLRLNTNRESLVSTAFTRLSNDLFPYGGQIGAHLIMGGIDCNGKHIVEINADGYLSSNAFSSLGSGSLAADGVLEARYKEDMTEEEGKELVADAISAGIMHDCGSGSTVNIVVIRKDGAEEFLGYRIVGKRECEKVEWKFTPNNTEILLQLTHEFEQKVTLQDKPDENKMDIE